MAMRSVCAVAVLIVVGVGVSRADESAPRKAYQELLAQFSVETPGLGLDSHFQGESDQAMTYGLVLWAEAIRYDAEPTDNGKARIRAAAQWLYDNRDLDEDGRPGWGLPKAYDTWGDGSMNPIHTPYTITTALCVLGLIEANQHVAIWSDDEQSKYRALVTETVLNWSRSAWTEGYGGGYFWYSPNPNDRIYCVNPSSVMLAAIVAAVARQPDSFSDQERAFLKSRADETLKALIETVQMREGAPYWRYAPLPNAFGHDRPNDALHQAYTLWGIETYRDNWNRVEIPWTRAQSIESVDRYTREGKPYLLPQDIPANRESARLDRLWGRGMVLAFYAKWGDEARAARTLDELKTFYGDWPRLKEWPTDGDNAPFFPRQAAHVLLGLSMMCFE